MSVIITKTAEAKPRRHYGCLIAILVVAILYAVGMGVGFAAGSGPSVSVKENSVYKLTLNGTIKEQGQEANPFASAFSSMPGYNETAVIGLDDLLADIRYAKENKDIKGIFLSQGLLSVAPASAKTIRDALLDFKTSGKWIIAYADNYAGLNYYIASVADKIYMNPSGSLTWHGLTAQKLYYTRLLENIGVEMQIVKVGTFKSAVEPYFRTSMSEADRRQTEQYLTGIWSNIVSAVSDSRQISAKDLNRYADEFMDLQEATTYVANHLIDSLTYPQQMDTIVKNLVGTKDFHYLTTANLTSVKKSESKSKNEIAIVYAEGGIVDEGRDGIIGKKMVKTLNSLLDKKEVKAVVFRVNSPGGSANASEQIWHAVTMLQSKGLPVVVSMGDYAASGGYYISCAADYIFAEPITLTGSIGIFGTIPSVNKLRTKIGLDIDGVETNAHSGLMTNIIYKGMSPSERQLMQTMVERGYDLFTTRCANGRHMSQDAIKRIGEGRVWLGQDAIAIGLVDSLGNINDAIAKAAALADITDYKTVSYPARKSFMDEFLASLNEPDTEEERIIAKVRAFVAQPRVMALMPEVTIE